MKIKQIICDKCGQAVEETKNGKINKITECRYEVDDKDLCPSCYEELKSKGEITCRNGFPEFTAKFEGR